MQSLPPSVTVSSTSVGISLLGDNGVTVQVSLPRPRSLHELSDAEMIERARRWARSALMTAAERLEHA
jgi:hypothetical protein